jgi:hypothetical protein
MTEIVPSFVIPEILNPKPSAMDNFAEQAIELMKSAEKRILDNSVTK